MGEVEGGRKEGRKERKRKKDGWTEEGGNRNAMENQSAGDG